MWQRRAHVLKPLTNKYGTKTFVWTDEMEKSFKEMKSLMAMDCVRQYPNHTFGFDIYTDYQMGACIMQNGTPVAYWSRKMNSSQRNYTTMEKEILSIVCCLK